MILSASILFGGRALFICHQTYGTTTGTQRLDGGVDSFASIVMEELIHLLPVMEELIYLLLVDMANAQLRADSISGYLYLESVSKAGTAKPLMQN